MFKVFIPKDTYVDLFTEMADKPESEQSDWYKILRKQRDVYFSGYQEDEELDPESELYLISMSAGTGKVFHDETTYINSLPSSPEKTLENPCGAFLLDVDEAIAKRIQESYGVICQSINCLNDCILAKRIDPVELTDGEKGYSWQRLLYPFNNCPSNSLIIIDRNMFSKEYYQTNSDGSVEIVGDGISNLYAIIDKLLPKKFLNEYHVLVVTDPKTLEPKDGKQGRTLIQLADDIKSLKKDLNRPYPISFEVIGIQNNSDFYKDTHNRRLVSNYFIVKADYMFRAFDSGRKSKCDQTITPTFLYSTGLAAGQTPPEKGYSHLIAEFGELIRIWKISPDGHPELQYAVNGKGNKSITEFKNRIICNFS